MFYFLSKTLDVFLAPMTWAILAFAGALFCLRRRRRTRARIARAMKLIAFGIGILAFFGMPWVSDRLLYELEKDAVTNVQPNVTYDAVVLLGGLVDNEAMEAWNDGPFYNDNVERLLETFDMLREGRARYAIVSGGSVREGQRYVEARVLADQLVNWGIAKDRILVEDRARNTVENAVFSQKIAKERGFSKVVIVTSAFHMPRAAACFAQVEMKVDLDPVDYGSEKMRFSAASWTPRAGTFASSSAALRELFGRQIYRLRGYAK